MTKHAWRHLHPLLFAAYPTLLLYSANRQALGLPVITKPLVGSVALAMVVYTLFLLAIRDADRAALSASGAEFFFFSFGWLWFALGRMVGETVSRPLLLVMYGCLLVVLVWSVVRSNLRFAPVNQVFTVFALVLIVLASLEIGYNEIERARAHTDLLGDWCTAFTTGSIDPQRAPDVYYIILDRYASPDVLEDVYGFDNSEFIDQLEQLGFYVDRAGRANYPVTMESVAATMNMQYLGWMTGRARDWSPLFKMIRESCVVRLFKSMGYTYVHFGSPWGPTRSNKQAVMNIPRSILTEFDQVLLSTTALTGIESELVPKDGTGKFNRVTGQLQKLPQVAGMEEPTFAFAHMLVPHPPYVFNVDGSFREMELAAQPTRQNYVDQVLFINTRILSVIKTIIESSEAPPIIVIQADEGPYPKRYDAGGTSFDWSSGTDEELRQKLGVFSAYLIPGMPPNAFHQGMTPVNSFRLIFKYGFGLPFGLLEDRSYVFHDQGHPYDFVDVTGRIGR